MSKLLRFTILLLLIPTLNPININCASNFTQSESTDEKSKELNADLRDALRELHDNFPSRHPNFDKLIKAIKAGADVNGTYGSYEDKPLIIQVLDFSVETSTDTIGELIKLLIDSGVRINGTAPDHNPLITAAYLGQDKAVQLLIDAGADVNAFSSTFSTALMDAASLPPKPEYPEFGDLYTGENYFNIVKALLKAGADIDITNHDGKTAIDFARNANNPEMVKLLEDEKKRRDQILKERQDLIKKEISEHLPNVLRDIVGGYSEEKYNDLL